MKLYNFNCTKAALVMVDSLAARLTPKNIGAFTIMPKQGQKTPTNPRPLSQRERTLIELYSHCQLGMTPQEFYAKWQVTHQELASICSRSLSLVQRWFTNGRSHRHPTATDLRHLALMDFLLEHFEEMPKTLFDLLCPPKSGTRK